MNPLLGSDATQVLRHLTWAQAAMTSPTDKARLPCGCRATATSLSFCTDHYASAMYRLLFEICEGPVAECQQGCCDPG